MEFEKKGKIELNELERWQKGYQMLPTPLDMGGGVLRILVGFCDENNVGRIGYVDVDVDNPSVVLSVSKKPILDIGRAGCFDDNGVVPLSVVRVSDRIVYLYYVGFQTGVKVPYYMFGGLAISEDGGNIFQRHSECPILDRRKDEVFHRCGMFVRKDDGIFKMWYIGTKAEGWTRNKDGKMLPLYVMKYTTSKDGLQWTNDSVTCMEYQNTDEHGMGRPFVWRENDLFRMLYCFRTYSRGYQIGYAESTDEIKWIRKDRESGITLSESGFDDTNQSYPYLYLHKGRGWLFYNGNGCGATGFGYAEIKEL